MVVSHELSIGMTEIGEIVSGLLKQPLAIANESNKLYVADSPDIIATNAFVERD